MSHPPQVIGKRRPISCCPAEVDPSLGIPSLATSSAEAVSARPSSLEIYAMDLEMWSERDERGLRFVLAGELTGPETAKFKSWVSEELEDNVTRLYVDCSKLHFIDSSGLGALIFLRKLLSEKDGEMTLVEVSGWLRKFLQVTGLEETFCGDTECQSD